MEKGIKILVVDDGNDFRNVMRLWLESKGYSVIEAPDGNTAIGLVKQGLPDIVFLDLNMPVMDGIETLKGIREVDKSIPVIIISAYLDQLKLSETKAYEISGIFYKDEDFERSYAILEAVLKRHKKLK